MTIYSLKKSDNLLFAIFIILSIIGFVVIYSATKTTPDENIDNFFFLKRQILWFAISIIFFFLIVSFDYTLFIPLSKYIYVVNIILLLITLFFGKIAGGSQRWIEIGSFQIQPSEFSKIAIIITLSSFFANHTNEIKNLKTILISIIHIAIPFFLIFKQPDLGTSVTLLFIWWVVCFVAGVNLKYLFTLTGLGILSLPYLFNFLKLYQKKRLLIFLNPSIDPLGSGYHLIQSKIAIGSGGIFGKGLFSGTQSQLNFIPSQHTDFIFSSIGEEFGFIGCLIILILFLILLQRAISIAKTSKDDFGRYVAIGIAAMFLFHIFVNIGMTVGIMPITGIPLPFLSYGGSSLLTNTICIALLLSIYLRKEKIRFS